MMVAPKGINASLASLKHCIPKGTVSYTHLDVYKRQVRGWPAARLPGSWLSAIFPFAFMR